MEFWIEKRLLLSGGKKVQLTNNMGKWRFNFYEQASCHQEKAKELIFIHLVIVSEGIKVKIHKQR